jgi:hypothetical protein
MSPLLSDAPQRDITADCCSASRIGRFLPAGWWQSACRDTSSSAAGAAHRCCRLHLHDACRCTCAMSLCNLCKQSQNPCCKLQCEDLGQSLRGTHPQNVAHAGWHWCSQRRSNTALRTRQPPSALSSAKLHTLPLQIVRQSLLASEEDSREQTAAADAAAADSTDAAEQGTKGRKPHGLANGSGELEGSIRHRATAAVYLAPRFCLLDFR